MVVDGADRIFASRLSENDVVVFDAQRNQERTITAPGLTKPTGIVLTWDCRLIVASFGSAELYEFRHDGTFLRKVSVAGMSLPESLAIAGQRLTGSFDPDSSQTMEATPACNPTPDGGALADAGAADKAVSGDGRADGAKSPGSGETSGCSCRVQGEDASPEASSLLPLLLLLVVLSRGLLRCHRSGARSRG